MLIDKYLPDFHYGETHSIEILSDRFTIAERLENCDFSKSRLIKILFWLRGMPCERISLSQLTNTGFTELERAANDEFVIGLIGQFWKPDGNLKRFDPAEFQNFNEPNFLKAVWNFRIAERNIHSCSLSTETRVYCTDQSSKKRFSRYWFFVRPFSGLIRMEMLKAVKRAAEHQARQEVAAG